MGYEFMALTSKGAIFPSPGMFISTSSNCYLPLHIFEENVETDDIENFLDELDVVKYQELSKATLIKLVDDHKKYLKNEL